MKDSELNDMKISPSKSFTIFNKWTAAIIAIFTIIGAGWKVTITIDNYVAKASDVILLAQSVERNSDDIKLNRLKVLVDTTLEEVLSLKKKLRQYKGDPELDNMLIKANEDYYKYREELRILKTKITNG